MSVVIACGNKQKIIIKSDGRGRDSKTKKIKSENIKKIYELSSNCIIGITGNYEFAISAMDVLWNYLKVENQ